VSADKLRFGIYPAPQAAPYAELAARARQAQEWGFDSLWLADQTPMAYPGLIELDAWSTLAALATETTDIRLGTLVTPAFLRHPLVLANAVSTVDHVSGGRVTVGLGAGGAAEDLAGLGLDVESGGELVDRLSEAVELVDLLLRGETVNHDGPHFRLEGATVPRSVQQPRPPIVVAAQGRRALEVAARHADTWNSLGGQPLAGDRLSPDAALATTAQQVEGLAEACLRVGRDPASIGRSVFAWRAGVFAAPDAFAEWVSRYRDLGFSEFILWWPGKVDQQEVLERIATDVIPGLRSEPGLRSASQAGGSGR
jgi:alkanesulfonate monooxygenase SsuD/methylene tetrahydromethanopterin reductase-like flavin-dependent oxidoreductase (luciferase family)